MPHFGLMDEYKMPPHEAALMRARLHIRGGRRRLRQGKVNAGLVTLFDALYYAMRWFVLSPDNKKLLNGAGKVNISDEAALYGALSRLGVTGDGFDFGRFCEAIEGVLENGVLGCGCDEILEGYDALMERLGVMPFDEGELPPEDPNTF